jgi:molybdopterin converting factor small subunit
MKVCFAKPFDELAGKKEIDLEIKGPIEVKDLLKILSGRFPTLRWCFREDRDELLNFSVLLVRGDEVLRLKDMIREQDTVKIFLPISGG